MNLRTSLAIVALMLLALAGPALAVAPGQCGTPDEMTAWLKAEGQRSIVSAQRYTPEKTMRGMIFTMNANRSVGFILESDQPSGDPANQFCVYARLANVRLFDARKPGPQTGALLKASNAEAERRCDELAAAGKVVPRTSCGPLNAIIERIGAVGIRVILQGFTVEKAADGSYRPNGVLTTVSGNVTGETGLPRDSERHDSFRMGGDIVYSALPEGASVIRAVLMFPKYTPYGLSLLQ